MRVLVYDAERCVACKACEGICSTTFFREDNQQKSKIRISQETDGLPHATFCNQCGECIAVCPTEALYRGPRGAVRLRQELCVGCLSCVGVCPYQAMFWHADQTVPHKCVSCGMCARECPTKTLKIVDVETAPAPVRQSGSV